MVSQKVNIELTALARAQLVGASSHTPKGYGFNPGSGNIPRLRVQSLVGACTGGNQLMFPPHISVVSLSFPVSQKSINTSLGEDFLKNMELT